jgi:hypothetical protein
MQQECSFLCTCFFQIFKGSSMVIIIWRKSNIFLQLFLTVLISTRRIIKRNFQSLVAEADKNILLIYRQINKEVKNCKHEKTGQCMDLGTRKIKQKK